MSTSRVTLIDGTALVFRAYHAIPANLKTTWGLPTNAIFGFAQMFRKVLAGRTPTLGAVVFDAPGQSFRKEISDSYKANRTGMPADLVEQLPHIDRVVEAHNFPILRVPGVEADDVIGTLTAEAVAAGHEVVIVSGDKDFCQLIGDQVKVFDPTREAWKDADWVARKYGVRPEQFRDWLALVGDRSDNIPGVTGIGKKGAATLLAEHGTLRAALDRAEELPGRSGKALRAHSDDARTSMALATIRTNVPLSRPVDALTLEPPTLEGLNTLYRELEFHSLLSAEALEEVGQGQRRAVEYFVCDTAEVADAALQEVTAKDVPVGVHGIYELPGPLVGDLVGIGIAVSPGRALYFPFHGPDGPLLAVERLRSWLEDPARPKVTHLEKNLRVALDRAGVGLEGVVFDTALASYLLEPTKLAPHRLEQVAREYLHKAVQPLKGVIGGGRSRKDFAELPVGRTGSYACHLADTVLQLHPILERRVRAALLMDHLVDRDMPLTRVLARMERHGVLVDTHSLAELEADLNAMKSAVETELFELVGHPFNVGSHQQLGTILFEELELPILKRTKTGYSTARDVLDRLRSRHPAIDLVIRWRTLAKLVNTYTEVLRNAVGEDGRIHCTIQQTVGASGRLITTDPDLQRTPVRTPEFRRVREAFVVPAGHQLISADWSQIELRVLAHFSEDPLLVQAYTEERDIHTQTAARLFEVAEADVTPAQRGVGKTVNFATIYGQGATALSRQLGIERKEARGYIERFFTAYAGVRTWRERSIYEAHSRGYVTTLLGRRRNIPELSAKNPTDRSYGERIAANTPIQGSAADLCKLAMLNVQRVLDEAGLQTAMTLTIHDELLFETPDDEVESARQIIRREMETVWAMKVPLVVDIGVGASWDAAH